MLTNNDLKTLETRGISTDTLDTQINRFKTGFPYLRLAGSANIGAGILAPNKELEDKAVARWDKYLADGGDVCKFVPASGAASRMFKALFAFVNGDENTAKPGSPVAELIAHLNELPFKGQLDDTLVKQYGKNSDALAADGRQKEIISAIVGENGMNYGNLPKGLLTFHKYSDNTTRTPLEEQLVEGAQTAAVNGKVNVHFTVSANHHNLFTQKIDEVLPGIEKKTGMKFNISMSEQKPSTDTVAVNPDNTLFRDGNNNLVFRPGGHGALIENLGDIDASVVFIKNIDNVVPDTHRADTIKYKKIIAGTLILAHDKIVKYSQLLNSGSYTDADLDEMAHFAAETLCIKADGLPTLTKEQKAEWFKKKFNRPLRVCGMVRNEGEPGGGPYIAYNQDGTASPQILESTQINANDAESVAMMKNATHFNPVDLVCYIKDINGKHFNLAEHVDHNTGFISEKSLAGKDLRALELPGLWNGAMSDWNTIFVEVPVSTFNPVKTVNDLLRPMHKA
jgi:hypothetical protein